MYCEGPTLNTWEFEYGSYVPNQADATSLVQQNVKEGDSHFVQYSIDIFKICQL